MNALAAVAAVTTALVNVFVVEVVGRHEPLCLRVIDPTEYGLPIATVRVHEMDASDHVEPHAVSAVLCIGEIGRRNHRVIGDFPPLRFAGLQYAALDGKGVSLPSAVERLPGWRVPSDIEDDIAVSGRLGIANARDVRILPAAVEDVDATDRLGTFGDVVKVNVSLPDFDARRLQTGIPQLVGGAPKFPCEPRNKSCGDGSDRSGIARQTVYKNDNDRLGKTIAGAIVLAVWIFVAAIIAKDIREDRRRDFRKREKGGR